jgi:hypothetical protein
MKTREERSWSRALQKRLPSIPPVTRAGISSRCWSSIHLRWWLVEEGESKDFVILYHNNIDDDVMIVLPELPL